MVATGRRRMGKPLEPVLLGRTVVRSGIGTGSAGMDGCSHVTHRQRRHRGIRRRRAHRGTHAAGRAAGLAASPASACRR
jgi:hypothetical protein